MAEGLDELQRAFRAVAGARATALQAAAAALRQGDGDAAASIRRMAHALRGVGGTYGFPEVTTAATACEEASEAALLPALDALLAVLRRLATEGPAAPHIILVVEDDAAVAALVEAALTAPGRRVVTARTTAAARMVVEAMEPDLIVLDLILPDEDGRSLLTQLRERPRSADVPIVVLSVLDAELVRAECMALGADDFLVKPMDPRVLAARVTTLLARRPPRSPAAEAAPAAPPGATPAGRTRSGPILLAEDDELIASVIVHRLTREGLEVRRYADGAAALAAAQASPHALVILDVKMPVMDGFELLERLRALPSYAATPILMLTSVGSERDIARGLALGAVDYVVKPFSPAELVARVARHLRG